MKLFAGNHTNTLDAKHRVAVPAPFRDTLTDGGQDEDITFYLTYGLDRCLYLLTEEEWLKRFEQLQELPGGQSGSRDVRKVRRRFMASSEKRSLDKQGRMVIPEEHREMAGIQKEVVFVGMGLFIELWSRKDWEDEQASYEDESFQGRVDDLIREG